MRPISTDYMVNTQDRYLETHQLINQQSKEDADLFIQLFENAIRAGGNPNDAGLQAQIFSQGNLGGFDGLMRWDQQRVLRRVEEIYQSNKSHY